MCSPMLLWMAAGRFVLQPVCYLTQTALFITAGTLIATGRCSLTSSTSSTNITVREGDSITLQCRTDADRIVVWRFKGNASSSFDVINNEHKTSRWFSGTHSVTFNKANGESTLLIRNATDAVVYRCVEPNVRNSWIEFKLLIDRSRQSSTTTMAYARTEVPTSLSGVFKGTTISSRNANEPIITDVQETVDVHTKPAATETAKSSSSSVTTATEITTSVRQITAHYADVVVDGSTIVGRKYRNVSTPANVPHYSTYITAGLAALLAFSVIVLAVLVILTLRKHYWSIVSFASGVTGREGVNKFSTSVANQRDSPICVLPNSGFYQEMSDTRDPKNRIAQPRLSIVHYTAPITQ